MGDLVARARAIMNGLFVLCIVAAWMSFPVGPTFQTLLKGQQDILNNSSQATGVNIELVYERLQPKLEELLLREYQVEIEQETELRVTSTKEKLKEFLSTADIFFQSGISKENMVSLMSDSPNNARIAKMMKADSLLISLPPTLLMFNSTDVIGHCYELAFLSGYVLESNPCTELLVFSSLIETNLEEQQRDFKSIVDALLEKDVNATVYDLKRSVERQITFPVL